MSITVIIIIVGAIGYTLYAFLHVKGQRHHLKRLVDAEVDRLRLSGETPRAFTEQEFQSIRTRFIEGGHLDHRDIEILAANQIQDDPSWQALQNPVAVLAAKGFEMRINDALREQGAAPMPPNPELDQAAKRHANEIGKQLIAKLEAEAAEKELLREMEEASQAVPAWVDANPHNPIAQRIIADLLEVSQNPALQGDAREEALATAFIKEHRYLLSIKQTLQSASELTQPPKRNRLAGGEEPIF
jgi:uncharacterized protein (DUF4415 family)